MLMCALAVLAAPAQVPPQPYPARVSGAVQPHLPVPNDAGQAATQPVAIRIHLDAKGHVLAVKLEESSGSAAFDAVSLTLLEQRYGAKGKETLPLPANAELRRQVLREGALLSLQERSRPPVAPTLRVPKPMQSGVKPKEERR